MKRCAYWTKLGGSPEKTNRETVTVTINRQSRLDIENLKVSMDQAGNGNF